MSSFKPQINTYFIFNIKATDFFINLLLLIHTQYLFKLPYINFIIFKQLKARKIFQTQNLSK